MLSIGRKRKREENPSYYPPVLTASTLPQAPLSNCSSPSRANPDDSAPSATPLLQPRARATANMPFFGPIEKYPPQQLMTQKQDNVTDDATQEQTTTPSSTPATQVSSDTASLPKEFDMPKKIIEWGCIGVATSSAMIHYTIPSAVMLTLALAAVHLVTGAEVTTSVAILYTVAAIFTAPAAVGLGLIAIGAALGILAGLVYLGKKAYKAYSDDQSAEVESNIKKNSLSASATSGQEDLVQESEGVKPTPHTP